MRPAPAFLCLCAALLLGAAPAAATGKSRTCVKTSTIRSVESVDAQTARFTLYNNEIYLNTFRSACGVSGFKGFGYKTPSGQLCRGNTMRAVGTGNSSVCILGRFEQVTAH